MGSPEKKWDATQEVVADVPKVEEVSSVPLGGERNDVVVDLESERQSRAGKKIASEKAKADTEELTQKAILDVRKRIELTDEETIKHRKQWLEDAPSEPMKESAGKMRSRNWADNESRGFFAKLFNRKSK